MESNDVHEKLKLSNGKGRLKNDIQTDIVLLVYGACLGSPQLF